MNNVWSTKIQGVKTLYLSRKLRFDDVFASRYKELFKIEPVKGEKLLEIGCGPGALSSSLHRWYPELQITSVDRDTNFIKFAKENEPGIEFIEADAAALPFPDGSFDYTISYTVSEHVAPAAFFGEQYRVLKPGGVCICLSVRMEQSERKAAPCLRETEEERVFWESVTADNDDFEKYGVGKYYVSETELLSQPKTYGFSAVTGGYMTLILAPDSPDCPAGFAERIIDAARLSDIEAATLAGSAGAGPVIDAINKKYGERLRLYREGKPQGDTSKTVVMAVIAEKT